ncbi:DgyrCDS4989 [Dimorphilus gyrociliatus]|uniref:Protein Wnt n=1 Tax=Dimorphilus gyrociliatus TaxID=2664684 RepID=A0A7I8VK13_9ANNE|nr:DgyrCDS4989 [Dimorphilus gyrociliatus]
MKSLYTTVENFMHYCPNSLENERWNCTTARKAPNFGGDLVYGTKQLAYVHAFSNAFLMRTIARACVSDSTRSCQCQTLNKKEKVKKDGKEEIFHYKGCVDNTRFAEKFATYFGDVKWNYKLRQRYRAKLSNRTRTRKLNTRNLVRLHNNELGREVGLLLCLRWTVKLIN